MKLPHIYSAVPSVTAVAEVTASATMPILKIGDMFESDWQRSSSEDKTRKLKFGDQVDELGECDKSCDTYTYRWIKSIFLRLISGHRNQNFSVHIAVRHTHNKELGTVDLIVCCKLEVQRASVL